MYRQFQRARIIWSYYKSKVLISSKWIFQNTETDNFYYQLQTSNNKDLQSIISIVTKSKLSDIERYFSEISDNKEISEQIRNSWRNDLAMRDSKVGLARRIGWYAVIRAMKPELVVETGVSHGVGALVICAALEKNQNEGCAGKYIGTDINPKAGGLLLEKYNSFGTVVIGDSLATLKSLKEDIGVFINDSDHSAEYESKEYMEIHNKLAPCSVILGDNAHATDSLRNYSIDAGRNFLFFKEIPDQHWYPGAGIGFSY